MSADQKTLVPSSTDVPWCKLIALLLLLPCSDKIPKVSLGLLKPLWHLYLKLTSKYDPSDSSVRPPLMLALTELFLAVELAAEVNIHVAITRYLIVAFCLMFLSLFVSVIRLVGFWDV